MKKILAIGLPILIAAGAAYHFYCATPHKETKHSDKPAVLCIGDSITFGAGVTHTRLWNSWPKQLLRMAGGSMQTLNYGISGSTLQREGDQPYRQDFLDAARSQKPETVILMLGTNDSKPQNWDAERYQAQLHARLEEIQNWDGVQQVYVMLPPWCCPPKAGEPVVYDIQFEVIRDEIRPIIQETAQALDVPVIDLFGLTEGHPEYFMDGVHPNAEGNRVIAAHILEAIS